MLVNCCCTMILAHILLPAMLIVICKSQQTSQHFPPLYGSDEISNIYNIASDQSSMVGAEELLDRYRQLIAQSLLKLYDSCKVHDFLQNIRRNVENESDDESTKVPGNDRKLEERYINAMLRIVDQQRESDASLFFPTSIDEQPKSALFYFITISLALQDRELDEILNLLLHEKCCKNDDNFYSCGSDTSPLRDSTKESGVKKNTIKKVKFHSWGGKRSGNNIGNSNTRLPPPPDMVKDLAAKVVIRAPFRPWGGKRQMFDGSA